MAVPRVFQLPKQTPFKLGVTVPGAKAQFYKAGTTTDQSVYTTADLDVAHSNPVVADASGEFATIYLDDDLAYRVQIKDASDVLIYDQDEINDPNIRAPHYDRSTAEQNSGKTPNDFSKFYGDTRRYSGGLADAIAVAQDSAAVVERRIVFAASETISSGLSITGDDIEVIAAGEAKLTYSGTGDAMTFGASGTLARGLYWDVPIVRSSQQWDDGTDTTSRGLVLLYCDKSTILVDIEGFNDGLSLYGTSGGNVHNVFRLFALRDNRRNLVIDRPGTNAGWNNSNYFYGGLIDWRSGTVDNACDNSIVFRGIDQVHASDNGNVFIGTDIEAASGSAKTANTEAALIRLNGFDNRILPHRIETNSVTLAQHVRWDTSAQRNTLDAGRYPAAVALTDFLDDSATQNTNDLLHFNNTDRYGTTRGLICGAIKATGHPDSAQHNPDQPYPACLNAGPNTNSHSDKIFAGLGSGEAVVSSITGIGRHGFGKDVDANLGHMQFTNPGDSNHDESLNWDTWERETTDATTQSINFDSFDIPQNSAVFVRVTYIARYADGSTVWSHERSALISRATGNATIETNTAVVTHDPDTFTGTGTLAISNPAQLRVEVTGVAATTIHWKGHLQWQAVIDA